MTYFGTHPSVSVGTFSSIVTFVNSCKAFIDVNTVTNTNTILTGLVSVTTFISNITVTIKAAIIVRADCFQRTIMVTSYAFVNIIAEYAITNVTFITFACIDTVVVVTSCKGITVMINTQTFINIITNDSVSGETIGTTAIIAS